jgi:O-antigen/teichoic acid export membrane protein
MLKGGKSALNVSNFVGILGSNVFNNLVSFVATIIVARMVEPSEFAKFSLAVAITTNLASIVDFGSSVALVRLYNATQNPLEKASLINTVVRWKFWLVAFVVLLTFLFGELVAVNVPAFQGDTSIVRYSLISAGLLSFWMTTRAVEQAQKKFDLFKVYVVGYGFLRFFFIAVAFARHQVSVTSIFSALYFLPLFTLVFYKLTSERFLDRRNPTFYNYKVKYPNTLKSVLGYGTWIGIAGVLFSLLFQIPQFLLAYTAEPHQVGLYGAGLTFLSVFLLVNDAVRTVLLPDVSAIRDKSGRQAFRNKLWRLSPTFFILSSSVLIGIAGIQYLLLGEMYRSSIPIFLVMGISTILVMYLGYFNTLVHSIGIPHVQTFVNATSLAALFMLCLMLPRFAISVAIALGGVLITGEVLTYVVVNRFDLKSTPL